MVLFIDVVLAGDNAIVVGMAAAGLPPEQRKKAIFWGIIAATLMRIGFASITVQLLQIVGIVLAGGVLLLWVCWKMYRELRDGGSHGDASVTEQHEGVEALENGAVPGAPKKTLRQAITQILVADVSMSLDNVLAVAGAAKDHPYILIIGLAVSVVLMGVAATFICRLGSWPCRGFSRSGFGWGSLSCNWLSIRGSRPSWPMWFGRRGAVHLPPMDEGRGFTPRYILVTVRAAGAGLSGA